MHPTPPTYRPEIDGLRAVAILLVTIFHFKLLPMGEAGFIGVDVFFVISGFLITSILVRDLEAGTFSLKAFYIARLRRLMPAMVATLALTFAVGAFVFLPATFAEMAREALWSQLYVVNIYFWRTIDYFGVRADTAPLLHMWSLAVEEQFYIFYPLALMLIFKTGRALLFPALLAITALSFLLGVWATGWKPQAAFYLLPTRAWELGVGGALALWWGRAPQGIVAAFLGIGGAALIGFALVMHTPTTPFPGWFAALPTAGAALLILAGPATPTGRVLSTAPMLWIGKISYPLYLVHWPILVLAKDWLEDDPAWSRWAGFALSFLLAWVIWKFVETPVRHRRVLVSPTAVLAGTGAAVAGIVGLGVLGHITQGLPGRIPPEARTLLAYADDTPKPFEGCLFDASAGNATPCSLGQPETPAEIAVIGDSHAFALAGAFDMWLKADARAGALYPFYGCPPLLATGPRRCTGFAEAALDHVAKMPEIETVFLVAFWRSSPGVFKGRHLNGAEGEAAFADAVAATAMRVREMGKRLVLVDPLFSTSARVPERLAKNLTFGRDRPVDRPLEDHQGMVAGVHAAFTHTADAADVLRISLIDDLCQDGTCRATRGGSPVFSDNNHIRFGMSEYFADQLAKAMAQ